MRSPILSQWGSSCIAVEMWSNFLNSQYQTSSSVDDRLEPNGTVLWQADKGNVRCSNRCSSEFARDSESHPYERPWNRSQLSYRMAKLVLTSPVTCDVMHRSLSRMRQRSWTLGSTAHAPMTKGLRSNLSILRDEAHQMNLDWKGFSYIRLQFISLQRWC